MHLNYQHYMALTVRLVRQTFWSFDVLVVICSRQCCACIAVHLQAKPGAKAQRGRMHLENSRLLHADLTLM